ncbi:MAG: ribosome-associated translation inhibitor RaiA [Firmicutes bacterium]|nr:ribosome-associated translation inhibitor RaiA [Bacillota bacterium]
MQIVTKGKNIEVTPALRDYAEKKVAKLLKFFGNEAAGKAEVMLRTERELHIVEVTVNLNGLLLRGEEATEDMYASIDGVVEKLERQVKKYKTRIHRKLRQDLAKEQQIAAEQALEEVKESEPDSNGLIKIVKTKKFAIKPMSAEEAAMQMDLLGHNFFVFANAETDEVNVIYKRKDGTYGLIEPEF